MCKLVVKLPSKNFISRTEKGDNSFTELICKFKVFNEFMKATKKFLNAFFTVHADKKDHRRILIMLRNLSFVIPVTSSQNNPSIYTDMAVQTLCQ